MTDRFRILVLGASGAFGARLARHLAGAGLNDLVLAGRREEPLHDVREEILAIAPQAEIATLARDRAAIDAACLRDLGATLVIDAAGPFQGAALDLPRACIAAGCHYLDLADGRDFVATIGALDEAARAADVAILSGASSTPALSHAVLDDLTKGWKRIDSIRAGIFPGNRAPRGRSLVEAILSWTGRPVRVFRDGGWTDSSGWVNEGRVAIDGLGRRASALCETPDLDLFVARYRPHVEAIFTAGLELAVMQRGLSAVGALTRLGLLRDPERFAPLLKWCGDRLSRFGTDHGGMKVTAIGVDADGHPVEARWTLIAEAGRGPDIPTLPAVALARRLARGTLAFRGAAPAAGHLALADLADLFDLLGVRTSTTHADLSGSSLFQKALGDGFDRLPGVTRAIHLPAPMLILAGEADITGATGLAARLIARLFRFPPTQEGVAARVVIRRDGDGERWVRIFGQNRFESRLSRPDPAARTVEERFGPARFRLRLNAAATGLSMTPEAGWFGPVRIPRRLLPVVTARESVVSGAHHFDVGIAAPLVGTLVRYRGAVRPET